MGGGFFRSWSVRPEPHENWRPSGVSSVSAPVRKAISCNQYESVANSGRLERECTCAEAILARAALVTHHLGLLILLTLHLGSSSTIKLNQDRSSALHCTQALLSALPHLEQMLAPAMLILGAGPTKHQPLAPTGLHLRELGAHVRTAGACDRTDGCSVWRAYRGNRGTARARDGAGRVASTGPAVNCC